MVEYIKRETLIRELKDEIKEYGYEDIECRPIAYGTILGLKSALSFVKTLPTADVVEVKHGEWEEYWDDDYMECFHRCSECKNDAPAKRDTYCDQVLTNYCPNCGVKMSRN